MDVQGVGGYVIDSAGFSGIDSLGKGGLTSFPSEPDSPTITGTPLPGFGTGFTATVDGESVALKSRVQTIEIMTGYNLFNEVYGSAYAVAPTYGIRRCAIHLALVDDDSAALNDLKLKADTDGSSITVAIVAGTVGGSTVTWTLNNVQPNAFNIETQGDLRSTDIPNSFANATALGDVDDLTLAFT
jgi:hypothetical protein